MKKYTESKAGFEAESEQERREFFRVSCDAEISILPFPEQTTNSPTTNSLNSVFSIKQVFTLKAELLELDFEANHILRQIMDHDKSISHFLKIINQKVDLIAGILAESQPPHDNDVLVRINLSEGGISTIYPGQFEEGEKVALKLNLLPDRLGILAKCKVKACQQISNRAEYQLNLEFQELEPHTQQIIARFLAREQRRHLSGQGDA